jgi:CheY-like chemotaxis protein
MENWKHKKILVVEDEIVNFYFISELLEKTQAQIIHAENGKTAVERCKAEAFDIVFMDIKMPVMDGIEATREIRTFDSEIAIIAQTSYAYKREECIAAGFTDYIAKPFHTESLMLVLKKHIK